MSGDKIREIGRRQAANVVDALLEISVVGSFSRMGYLIRRRMDRWDDPGRLDDKTIVVTGASSGIGRAIAVELASLGANVWLVGRNPERLRAAAAAAEKTHGGGQILAAEVDVTNSKKVSELVDHVSSVHKELHGLIHNAGALFADFGLVDDGTGVLSERTVATHVLAPYRLSLLLAPLLMRAERSVIATVTSGGMYTQRFDPEHIEASPNGYRGATVYARAKRAQVVLSHSWARRWGDDGVASYAVHPGWADTPGLRTGLPHFAKLGPLLRTPAEGADTTVWLAADEPRRAKASAPLDGLWFDRRQRGEYYLPSTRRSPTERVSDGEALWNWCANRSGMDFFSGGPIRT
jgi:NAD(P)-dependent dehydrogenase (short-subunit alcohol dehydrogenase family)